ncbi:delta(8)-fatty-acid desaturase 2-like [Ananas comosus]|uniref:Delta(8)-fatty-acid desaturase 2-like n=1 Tax=Ananas comosus TaxID=4615 RepID=A0A6P5FPW7_ANACO|nr:delta(8)-fatty-acid desaturase 2-like [Ananas comosus]
MAAKTKTTKKSQSDAAAERYITTEELRRHNKASDLWISIQGKVYDVTAWAERHPGGALPLLSLGGQDVTDAFVAYHPPSAWALLDRLCVARLADYAVSDASRDYRRLVAEFARAGLFEKRGRGALLVLAAMLLMLAAAVYGVLASSSAIVHLLSAALMGALWMQSGFLGHDSGHYNVLPTPALNRLVQVVAGNCMAGISIEWWKQNHNAHHIACNSLDFDPDVQHMPLFAVSAKLFASLRSAFYGRTMRFDRAARLLVSYQHWTFYPVMCLARLNLFAQSLVLLLSPAKRVPHRAQELLGLLVFWTWFPLLLSFLPSWTERLAFVLVSFAATGVQHVQFCLNHFSSSVYVGPPRGNDWFEKQTAGTLDISCSPWMDWFHGGLQFQVEHHLFPRLPRCHLRRVAPLVQDLCKKHGLQYSSSSFWDANLRTLATLRAAALQARDLANPVPKNLVWEAVNTHG